MTIGLSPDTAAVRISYPSARAPCPDGVLTTMSTSPAVIRSTIVGSPAGPRPVECLRTTVEGMPLRRSTAEVPSVARISKPISTSRLTGNVMARLSRSATEMNTRPDSGKPPNAAAWDLANAVGKSTSNPITSPVERISGPRMASTICPSAVRNRRNGSTASFTAIGASRPIRPPSPCAGSTPEARSSAIVAPAITRAAALASGTPVALATNGTVRLARGLASRT